MGVHYKFVLDRRRKKANAIYPVRLRVYDNDGNKETSLDIFVNENDWDDENQVILSGDPNYKTNSFKLNSAKNKVERKILIAEDEEDNLTPEQLILSVNKTSIPKNKTTLQEYAQRLIADQIRAGKAGNAMSYAGAVNSLIAYTGNNKMKFEDITYRLLDKYNTEMLAKGTKVNSIAAYLRGIRAIFNKAMKEEIVAYKHYPFNKFRIETEDTISRALTLDEMKKIASVELKANTPAWHSRNLFFLSFSMIGMNFADMVTLEPANISAGRIVYSRSKTGRIYNIGIHSRVQEIFSYYRSAPSKNGYKFILPQLTFTEDALQEHNEIKQICKTCNKHMKQIAKSVGILKPVSTYWARYTWANLAKKNLNVSNEIIADALGHQYSNKVTAIYLDNYTNEVIDETNRAVIDLVFS